MALFAVPWWMLFVLHFSYVEYFFISIGYLDVFFWKNVWGAFSIRLFVFLLLCYLNFLYILVLTPQILGLQTCSHFLDHLFTLLVTNLFGLVWCNYIFLVLLLLPVLFGLYPENLCPDPCNGAYSYLWDILNGKLAQSVMNSQVSLRRSVFSRL